MTPVCLMSPQMPAKKCATNKIKSCWLACSTSRMLLNTYLGTSILTDWLSNYHVTASLTDPEFDKCTIHCSRSFACTDPGIALYVQKVPTVCDYPCKKGWNRKTNTWSQFFSWSPGLVCSPKSTLPRTFMSASMCRLFLTLIFFEHEHTWEKKFYWIISERHKHNMQFKRCAFQPRRSLSGEVSSFSFSIVNTCTSNPKSAFKFFM